MNRLDRRFLNVGLVVESVLSEPPETMSAADVGKQYLVSATPTDNSAFDEHANDIAVCTAYESNEATWEFTEAEVGGLEVINKATGAILKWNGTAWAVVTTLGGTVPRRIDEVHVVDQSTVIDPDVFLNRACFIYDGRNDYDSGDLFVSLNGMPLVMGTDYEFRLNNGNDALIGISPSLKLGDIVVVSYYTLVSLED